jgi:hypothetical protein
MSSIISRSLLCLVPAVLAASLAADAATTQAAPFQASGTDEITSIHGNQGEGVSRGVAQPGGPFIGVWSATQHGFNASGLETWDFGGGDMLTWFWEAESDKNHVSLGTFTVIGGTGRFKGARGSADYLRIGHGDGTGEFVLEGVIELR